MVYLKAQFAVLIHFLPGSPPQLLKFLYVVSFPFSETTPPNIWGNYVLKTLPGCRTQVSTPLEACLLSILCDSRNMIM